MSDLKNSTKTKWEYVLVCKYKMYSTKAKWKQTTIVLKEFIDSIKDIDNDKSP